MRVSFEEKGHKKVCIQKPIILFSQPCFSILTKTFDPLPLKEKRRLPHARYSYGVKEQRVKREMSTK